jgi:hypothetical protein
MRTIESPAETAVIALFAACLFAVGCSEQTKTETKEALHEAGEAVSSATEDAKKNTARAAGAVEDALSDEDETAAPAPAPTAPVDAAPATSESPESP